MSDPVWLTGAQMARFEPYSRKFHGKPRVQNPRAVIGLTFVDRNGLRWWPARGEYSPHTMHDHRWAHRREKCTLPG